MEDRKIIELFFERSEKALDETEKKYGRYCHTVAYSVLGSKEDTEEVVNDTYLRAWNSIPPAKPQRLSTYLGKITRNLALNRLRDGRRRLEAELVYEEIAEAIPDVSGDPCEDIELRDALNDFLADLDKTRRRMFVSRYFYMRSIREISREMGVSEGAVKVGLSRTRKRLREFLSERGIVI